MRFGDGRYVRVTKPQVNKMLKKQQGSLQVEFCPKGIDVNKLRSTKMVFEIKSMEELKQKVDAWEKFSGTKEHWLAIWKEEERMSEM